MWTWCRLLELLKRTNPCPRLMRAAGVLTKLDIMDPGTDARDILDNAAVRLKHGWIGVINRGQADINSRVRGHPQSLPNLYCLLL